MPGMPLLCWFAIGVLSLGAAQADDNALRECISIEDNADRKIARCTEVIDATPAVPAQARAQAHFQRARAYRARGELRRAMNEFHAGYRLDSTNRQMERCTADAILAADAENRRAQIPTPLEFCTLRAAARR